jgi:hypothetical protein
MRDTSFVRLHYRREERNMAEMWCHRVDGDAFRGLVVESARVLVSTGKHTLAVDRHGNVLERRERRDIGRAPGASPTRLGEFGYALGEGELLRFETDELPVSRTPILLELFARHRERLSRSFADPTDEILRMVDEKISGWYRSVHLGVDRARERLLAIGQFPPWLASIRTDGTVDWVLIVGKYTDCCNSVGVVSHDGTLAHVSSCGQRITFITARGEVLSALDVEGHPGVLTTEGRDIAYVTFPGEGVAAYRPNKGHVGSVEIPGVTAAEVRDGVLYCVTEDPVAGILLKAFEEPSLG